jgi:hypothetical protein
MYVFPKGFLEEGKYVCFLLLDQSSFDKMSIAHKHPHIVAHTVHKQSLWLDLFVYGHTFYK